ncbi:intermediate filament protein A-like [Liolophura sinensis]|uniref:intermediate filament protein A-like n=1 Tax=Liolophura sinensis TaxID=3198878 RepID=UPI0031593773
MRILGLNLKDVVKLSLGQGDSARNPLTSGPVNVGEATGRVTVQRSSRGPVGFSETAPDGRYVVVENTGSLKTGKVMQLTGWKVRRIMADNSQLEYTFDECELPPGGSVKIWARDGRAKRGPKDKCTNFDNWGVGNNTTYLYDTDGGEKATIVQKFVM